VIDTDDLLDALNHRTLDHAVLDVFETEPLPPDHPLWAHPAVTVLPHIAAPTDPASAIDIVAKNINAYRDTGQIPDSIDLERGY